MIVDKAIYDDGQRLAAPDGLGALRSACQDESRTAWVGLYRPDEAEFAELARVFDLHPLAVEDAVHAHQRSKLEHYGPTVFLVLRPARYIHASDTVEFGEVHVFAGPQFVITVRHAESPDLHAMREKLEARPDVLRRGPIAITHAILDRVVDDYEPIIAGIEEDIDEIENEVFGEAHDVSRRIYQLTREVIAFQRAIKPLVPIIEQLIATIDADEEERSYLRDVNDHAIRVQERADGFRELLTNIFNVNLTLETKALSEAANATNDEVQKISAWAAILFAPTLIGTIYGMNFRHMPELHWLLGYPFALGLMVVTCGGLFASFRRRGWI